MERKQKRKAVFCLAVAIAALLVMQYLFFSHGIEWYYSLMETPMTRIGVFLVNAIFGVAIWGFGKTINAKKWVKTLLCIIGLFNFFGSVLGILLALVEMIFPSIRNLSSWQRSS